MSGATSIAQIVRIQREERPDAVAVIQGDDEYTWRHIDEVSSRLANALLALGVGPHDRVARIEKNGVDYIYLMFAVAKINAVLVDVNWRLAPPEKRHILADAQAKVLFFGTEFASEIDAVTDGLDLLDVFVIDGKIDGYTTQAEFYANADPTDPNIASSSDDIASQLYTSGTTGQPKGVMLSNRNLFAFIDVVPGNWNFSADSVSHVVMPMFHIAGSGWALAGLSAGATTVVMRDLDPAAILAEIERRKITHAIYVPAVLQFLQMTPSADEHDLSSMQLVAYGGSPITSEVLRGALDKFSGVELVQLYGMTETTGAVVELDGSDHDPEGRPELLRAAGKPYPWIEMRIVDPDGNDLGDDEVGEVWIRGPQVMVGYWNMPEATAAAITDGWLHTGDAGYTHDGYLYLFDRVKDMIVSGGENVYPAEVENVIMECDGVADVAVIGVPDDKWGEAVKAVVVRATDSDVTEQDVIEHCRGRIAGYKIPKSVDFGEVLPRNPSGKILKKDLRAPYWEGRDRQIG